MNALILAAGYGTRFLPITKTISKEMLPIWNRPLIDFILSEILKTKSIKQVLILNSRRKKDLENYLDYDIELNNFLLKKDPSSPFLKQDKKKHHLQFFFTRQFEMKGTADAILYGEYFLKHHPYFILYYPDDIFLNSLSNHLIYYYNKYKKNILTVIIKNKGEDLSKYGILNGKRIDKNIILVQDIQEKPKILPWEKDSYPVILGRYLLKKEIFSDLKQLKANQDINSQDEFPITDLLKILAQKEDLLAYITTEKSYLDCGTPLSYIKSLTRYSLSKKNLKNPYQKFLRNLLENMNE